MNDQITWITAEEYALAATRHAAEMEKAAWTPVLKAFFDGTTDPNALPSLINIYPPPAAKPGGTCGRRNLITSGFLPMICTLKDWWEDYEWWDERVVSCGTWYRWGDDPNDWGSYWVGRFYHYRYYTDELIDGEWTQVWHRPYWDRVDRANDRANLNCNRWDILDAWKNAHQVDMGPLPAITTSLANDGWLRQTLYTYTVGGATLDGVTQTAPLILLRSRPMGSQLSPLANPSCLVAAAVTPTVAMVSACLEAPNQAAFNGNRQFSNPNPRVSNDLIRVMEREQQK
jgi:hypothetical protein